MGTFERKSCCFRCTFIKIISFNFSIFEFVIFWRFEYFPAAKFNPNTYQNIVLTCLSHPGLIPDEFGKNQKIMKIWDFRPNFSLLWEKLRDQTETNFQSDCRKLKLNHYSNNACARIFDCYLIVGTVPCKVDKFRGIALKVEISTEGQPEGRK